MTAGPAAVLAEALDMHRYNIGGSCNGCDWVATDDSAAGFRDQHTDHQATVLAGLPNIAVIELPEGENKWHITDWDTGRVSLCHGVDTVRCYLPNPALETVEAEQLGIALIAASRVLAAAHKARQ